MMAPMDLSKYRPKALRHCVAAGEALNPDLVAAWREGTGHHIYEGYGQTESTLQVAQFPGIAYKPGSMGVVAPGFQLGIVDEQGNELPAGEEGEIAIRVRPERPVGLFPATGRIRRPTPGPSAATGTTPATAPPGTPTATSGSSAAPTT